MLAPAGQATARAGQLCWLAALVARRQAPRTPLPKTAVRRGRACPARDLPPNPFHGQFVGEGFIPPGHFPLPQAATAARGLAALHMTREGLLTRGASGTPPPTIVAANSPAFVGAGHARPATYRQIPFMVQSVGEGFIPPAHPPAAANLHGGQRAGRPTTPLKTPPYTQ